jgi:hypothetical protein
LGISRRKVKEICFGVSLGCTISLGFGQLTCCNCPGFWGIKIQVLGHTDSGFGVKREKKGNTALQTGFWGQLPSDYE